MRRISIVSIVLAASLFSSAHAQLNTSADDYAAAFRSRSSGALELWFTSSRDAENGRSRSMYIADGTDTGFANIRLAPSPVNVDPSSSLEVVLTGTPAFALCDGDIGMFVSNRGTGTEYTGNDIYVLSRAGSEWKVEPLRAINSSEWDDSPALTADGSRVYFASDRRYPGTRHADLYMSELRDGAWTEPRPLIELNTVDFSEETPFVSEDGFLYYSSNRAGDFDIWRTKLDDRGLPRDAGEPVAGINRTGSDETHPVISPGGGFFLYSTNAHDDGRHDFDIKWIKLKRHDPILEIDIRKRHRQTTERVASTLELTTSSRTSTIETSANAPSHVALESILGDPSSPAADKRQFQIIAKALTPEKQFISAIDTLIGYRTCSSMLPHTVFLWDTSTYYEQSCIDTFPIKKVQYFVTGYWCPTTKRFESYLECPTLFYDTACLRPVCPPSDLFTYKVNVNRQHSECIDYKEFDRMGAGFAEAVDDAIEQHLKAMESAFGSACMKRTIAQGKPVRVVVEGFTDPRGYGADCHYFGPDIDFSHSGVQVPEDVKSHFHHDVRMKEYGAQGNQLLSELRAYNLAVLLDKVWTERIEQYRDLKARGLLTTMAIGRAISQDAIPFEQRRSAQVSVAAESEGVIIPGQVPPPGERVVLCRECQ